MRTLAALSLALLLVLAGCSAPFLGGQANNGSTSSPTGGGATAMATAVANTPGNTAGTTGTTVSTEGTPARHLTDPPQDVLGWEGGLWYNESISVSAGNGLNASEQGLVVNRTMARIETIRRLEFTEPVPVDVISRGEFQRRPSGISQKHSAAFRTFDNAKFEAMFLVGENENSLAVQESNRGQNVLGYYSPQKNSIVVISPSGTPKLTRSTLSHELVHALQDQQFNLSSHVPRTREAANARNGLVEGGANYVQHRYGTRCNTDWRCIHVSQNRSDSPADFNIGVYILSFFPYADGPQFVDYFYDHEGWAGVNDLYENPPASTEQVIHPRKYGRDFPTNVTLRDTSSNGWTRVRPDTRPDYAVLGQSALSTMFAYTLYDDYNTRMDQRNGSSVIAPTAFLNVGASGVNRADLFDYDLNYTDGWDGDKMYIYQKNNETGYVWKITWDSRKDAREFVRGYRKLLAHWGGEHVLGREGVWEIRQDSPFTDAFRITRQGNTVTIVNAPQSEDLNDIHAPE
ncbi:MAG TPA: Hvo_1808 family surface protein [Halococcus sp.]|nr:Hvo_1808 family surface protein [Halococcus sp.]